MPEIDSFLTRETPEGIHCVESETVLQIPMGDIDEDKSE